jgi:hypothetical protein
MDLAHGFVMRVRSGRRGVLVGVSSQRSAAFAKGGGKDGW